MLTHPKKVDVNFRFNSYLHFKFIRVFSGLRGSQFAIGGCCNCVIMK